MSISGVAAATIEIAISGRAAMPSSNASESAWNLADAYRANGHAQCERSVRVARAIQREKFERDPPSTKRNSAHQTASHHRIDTRDAAERSVADGCPEVLRREAGPGRGLINGSVKRRA